MKTHLLLFISVTLLAIECVNASESPGSIPITHAPPSIELRDQYDAPRKLSFRGSKVVLLAIADRKGADEVAGWIAAFKPAFAERVDIRGLANVGGVPGFIQAKVRRRFQETRKYPVMMDWSGKVCEQFGYQGGVANMLVIDREGVIRARFLGSATESAVAAARNALESTLSSHSGAPAAVQN